MTINQSTPITYDIFCQVIDNYGDIALCWQLALQLQHQHQKSVRLWVNDLNTFQHLLPNIDPAADHQTQQEVAIYRWYAHSDFQQAADVVIEAFGCHLPDYYRQQMLTRHSLCINLEYFSCEPWVVDYHGMRSLQHDGLHQYIFFPSLQPQTGNILFEADYAQQHTQFLAQSTHWCQQWQVPVPRENSIRISLFAYENQSIIDLIQQASQYPQPIDAYLPESKLSQALQALHPQQSITVGNTLVFNNLRLHILPFLPQAQYDRLLWLCHLNFVRGEVSLTRAILAGKPCVWHIYPTDDQAHWDKLAAFMQVYRMHNDLIQLNKAWNQQQPLNTFSSVLTQLPLLTDHAQHIAQTIQSRPSLSDQLVHFAQQKAIMPRASAV